MALPATDSFTGADNPLTTYSGNWTLNKGNFQVLSNALHSNAAAADTAAHWNADAFADDQYAFCTVPALVSFGYVGPGVRIHASAETFYGLMTDSADAVYLFKYVSGTYTQLGAVFGVAAAGDKLKLEVVGTTLEYFKDTGGGWVSQGTRTDSSTSSGSAGIVGYDNATGSILDDWEGGNISDVTIQRLTLLGVG